MVDWEYCTLTHDVDAGGNLCGRGRLQHGTGRRLRETLLPIDLESTALHLGAAGWDLVGVTRVGPPARGTSLDAGDQIVLIFRRPQRQGAVEPVAQR